LKAPRIYSGGLTPQHKVGGGLAGGEKKGETMNSIIASLDASKWVFSTAIPFILAIMPFIAIIFLIIYLVKNTKDKQQIRMEIKELTDEIKQLKDKIRG